MSDRCPRCDDPKCPGPPDRGPLLCAEIDWRARALAAEAMIEASSATMLDAARQRPADLRDWLKAYTAWAKLKGE